MGEVQSIYEFLKTVRFKQTFSSSEFTESPVSLFITGPSRSGKTTLERLTGQSPHVKRGFENSIVENSVRSAFQRGGFPTYNRLVELPPLLNAGFRDAYVRESLERAESAKVLTNTLPPRIEDAIRAGMEIPKARFVFIKRNRDDIAIRIYMRNYATGNVHASHIADIYDYVDWCHKMIDLAAEKMPDITRVIHYEDMVEDPAATVKTVAELCDIEFADAQLPPIGDDRGCAEPYLKHMAKQVAAAG